MEGINRYVDVNFDQPMSNYVPLPLDTLYKLGKDADKTYEDTLKDLDSGRDPLSKLKLRTSVKVYDPSVEGGVRDAAIDFEDQKANYLDYINKQKQMIVDDYIKDKDSAKFRQRASKLKGDVTSIYNDLASKSAIVDKIDKHNAEIEKQQDPSLKEFLRNKELEYNTGYYNQYQQGKLNDYSSYNTAKYTDRAKEVKEFFGSLGEEVQQMYASPTGDGYIRTKYLEGRTKDKIRNTFDSWFENSTVKADMDLELNDLFARTGMNPKAKRKVKVDGKEVEVTNYDYFRNQQMNQALDMAYGFSTSKGHEDLKADSTWNKKHAEELANLTTTTQSEGIATGIEHPTVRDMEFDSKGNLVVPTKKVPVKTGGTDEFGVYDPNMIQYKNEGKDLDKMVEQVRYIKEIQMNHPELKDLSPKATLEAVKKAQKSVETESIPLNSISNLAAKSIGEAIARNMGQRNFYLYDSKGKTIDGTRETVLDELGLTDVELQEQIKKNGISGYTQAGPTPGGLYVDVKDKKDNTRRLVISQDAEIQKIFSVSHAVNEARKTLTPTVLQPIEGVDYKVAVKPTVTKDGSVKWDYIEIINGVPKSTTLDDIRKQEKEALKESNYLGSQIQNTKDEEKDIE